MMSKSNKYAMDELLKHRLKDASAAVPENMWSRIVDARKDRRVHPYGWAGFSALILITAAFAGWMAYGEYKAIEASPSLATVLESGAQPEQFNGTTEQSDISEYNKIRESTDTESKPSASSTGLNITSETSKYTSSNTSLKKTNTALKTTSSLKNESKAASSAREESAINAGSDEAMILNDAASNLVNSDLSDRKLVMQQHLSMPALNDRMLSLGTRKSAEFFPGTLKLGGNKKGSPSCYSFNSFLRGLSIDAYMAPEYAARQLVYKEPGMIDYAALRNETESYSFAFSMGFRANAHFKGGLALRTGLIYTDIVEKLQFKDPNAEITKVITINIDTLYDGPNQIIRIDTLSIVEFGQHDKIGYNRYRFFDVPLILAYEIDRGRWIIHLNTGVMLNVATAQRGSFLDPESNLVSINSNGVNSYPAFRKKVGSSLLMSLGFNYAIKPKLHVLVEPQLRVWMSPLNIKDYPVDQKYVNIGLAMGVRQYF